jgi:RNA polymerase sigma factor (sigma-70 family)
VGLFCDYVMKIALLKGMRHSVQPPVEVDSTLADDLKLVAEVLSKDRKATAEFVSRYADCVYSYVRRRVMPRPEAVEDLVQETFLAAWQNLPKFRGEAGLRPWLLGIARHKVEDYYRRRLREAEWPPLDDESVAQPSVVPRYEERLDWAQRQKKVERTLAALPETYALALLWRYTENLSTREMAQNAGKTEKAIERLLARAREHFRRRWNHAEP